MIHIFPGKSPGKLLVKAGSRVYIYEDEEVLVPVGAVPSSFGNRGGRGGPVWDHRETAP